MSSLNKFGQLSPINRRLLFQAFLLLPILHVTLFVLGYYRLRGMIEKLSPRERIDLHNSESDRLQRARDISRLVMIAAQRGLYKATCLRRSILVWWFLRKENMPSEICFGVRMLNQHLEAHAWVEYQGFVINDSANVREDYQILQDIFPQTNSGL